MSHLKLFPHYLATLDYKLTNLWCSTKAFTFLINIEKINLIQTVTAVSHSHFFPRRLTRGLWYQLGLVELVT